VNRSMVEITLDMWNRWWRTHTWYVNRWWRSHMVICESMVEITHGDMWINGGDHTCDMWMNHWWWKTNPWKMGFCSRIGPGRTL
jgi:hypothetical protein